MAGPMPGEGHVSRLLRRSPLLEHVPLLGHARPAPGGVGEGLDDAPVGDPGVVCRTDDRVDPGVVAGFALIAGIGIECDVVSGTEPKRDLPEASRAGVGVHRQDGEGARVERVDELRPRHVLCRSVRARVRIWLVREEVAGDLRIAGYALEPALQLGVGDLPTAGRVVIVADPDKASSAPRETVGLGL